MYMEEFEDVVAEVDLQGSQTIGRRRPASWTPHPSRHQPCGTQEMTSKPIRALADE